MEIYRKHPAAVLIWFCGIFGRLEILQAADTNTPRASTESRNVLREQAHSAGVPPHLLDQFDYSWIVTGSPDPRFRVHGFLKTSDGACRTAPSSWQGTRSGPKTACVCERILYNSGSSPMRRCKPEDAKSNDLVTGCIAFSGKDSAWLDIGVKNIEAGVCYSGPCCDVIDGPVGTAKSSNIGLPEVYLQLPYTGQNSAACTGTSWSLLTVLAGLSILFYRV